MYAQWQFGGLLSWPLEHKLLMPPMLDNRKHLHDHHIHAYGFIILTNREHPELVIEHIVYALQARTKIMYSATGKESKTFMVWPHCYTTVVTKRLGSDQTNCFALRKPTWHRCRYCMG